MRCSSASPHRWACRMPTSRTTTPATPVDSRRRHPRQVDGGVRSPTHARRGASGDRRAPAFGGPQARLPRLARCPVCRARRIVAWLRASRRSPPARQHPPPLMATSTAGRSARPRKRGNPQRRTPPVLAVDVGGTIAVGLVDSDGTLVYHERLPTPDGDAEAVWAVAERLIVDATRTAGGDVAESGSRPPVPSTSATAPSAPSTSLPGNGFRSSGEPPTDRTRRPAGRRWTVHGARRAVVRRRPRRTVPARHGGVHGHRGGLVLDGAPYDGRTGNAGHVGHVVVDPEGLRCTCGGRGCVETVASGPHLAQWARDHGWTAPPDADAKELAEAAGRGDAVALQAFRAERLRWRRRSRRWRRYATSTWW